MICQHCIQEDIRSLLNSGYVFRYSFHNLCLAVCYSKTNVKVLCGCETLSRTLSEKYRLGVTENRMLRRIFGPRRQVTDGQRKVQNGELSTRYYYDNQIREHGMVEEYNTHLIHEKCIQNFSRKTRREETT
jgi:hypothetical protein